MGKEGGGPIQSQSSQLKCITNRRCCGGFWRRLAIIMRSEDFPKGCEWLAGNNGQEEGCVIGRKIHKLHCIQSSKIEMEGSSKQRVNVCLAQEKNNNKAIMKINNNKNGAVGVEDQNNCAKFVYKIK